MHLSKRKNFLAGTAAAGTAAAEEDLSCIPDSGPRAWSVELLPGVQVPYAAAGLVNLGVPIGTDAYVQYQLGKQLDEQAETMRKVVA